MVPEGCVVRQREAHRTPGPAAVVGRIGDLHTGREVAPERARHIQPKRLHPPDKRHAEKLKRTVLAELAARNDLVADENEIAAL